VDEELVAKLISTRITLEADELGRSLSKKRPVNPPATLIFVVDSLKNVNDVLALRRIFRDEFLFAFVSADRETRWHRIKEYQSWTDLDRPKFEQLDAVDRDEKGMRPSVRSAGQETGKLAPYADYYVVNDHNRQDLQESARRIVDLFLGGSAYSQPTADERRMHLAFSASHGSACLSRHVGAALFNSEGDIIGLGHNDVPKAGGGLYSVEDGDNDNRCYLVGDSRCTNDTLKSQRFARLADSICRATKVKRDDVVRKTIGKSELQSATEYCRAVHAEMSALMSAARSSVGSTIGSTMYVTTYPCHNCAKHILSAGVKRVVYVEPYPKSLAADLHSDGLSVDSPTHEETRKTVLAPYQGVAPGRFHDLFAQHGERKDKDGRAIRKSKEQRAAMPSLSSRVYRRTRSMERFAFPGSDPITYEEFKASNEVWMLCQNRASPAKRGNRSGKKMRTSGKAGRARTKRGSERHP
jgi:deoxycytidylate deaminase